MGEFGITSKKKDTAYAVRNQNNSITNNETTAASDTSIDLLL